MAQVGIATGLRAGRPGFDSRQGKIFLFSTVSRPALGATQPPIQWVPEVKRPRREADHSPPSAAEVKKGRSIPPLQHTPSWRSVYVITHRDNFVLTVLSKYSRPSWVCCCVPI
jgi:hypothetical protein